MKHSDYQICFVGHVHKPLIADDSGLNISPLPDQVTEIRNERKYISTRAKVFRYFFDVADWVNWQMKVPVFLRNTTEKLLPGYLSCDSETEMGFAPELSFCLFNPFRI